MQSKYNNIDKSILHLRSLEKPGYETNRVGL